MAHALTYTKEHKTLNKSRTLHVKAARTEAGGKKHPVKLYASMFKIGLAGFGGGSALIPVIEREVVREEHLLCQEAYDKDVVVACITPGALPVEVATGLGKRAFGVRGMLISALLMAFPGAFLTVLILSLLQGSSNQVLNQIQFLSIGLGAFISTLLILYAGGAIANAASVDRRHLVVASLLMSSVFVLTCGNNFHKLFGIPQHPLFALSTIQVLGLAFFLLFYTNGKLTRVNVPVSALIAIAYVASFGKGAWITSKLIHLLVIALMVVLAISGIVRSFRNDIAEHPESDYREKRKLQTRRLGWEVLGWSVFVLVIAIPAVLVTGQSILYLVRGFISSIMSFGGGDAYLSVADGMFVSTHTLTNGEFYARLVPVANVLPGSILCKILTGVGYYLGFNVTETVAGGVVVALAGFGISVAASGMVFCMTSWAYETFEDLTVFRLIGTWIRPIIGGLLLNVALSMVNENLNTGFARGLGLAPTSLITVSFIAVNLILLIRYKVSNIKLIGLSAVAGLIICNIL